MEICVRRRVQPKNAFRMGSADFQQTILGEAVTTYQRPKDICSSFLAKTALLSVIVISLAGNGVSASRHFSTLEGNTIRMEPSGASFQIPLAWTKEYGAVSTTQTQLQKVRSGKGEWYKEYSRIVSGALPFRNCSVQAGTGPWDGASFGGVQMRAYVFTAGAPESDAKIAVRALAAARSLPKKTVRNAQVERSEAGRWHKSVIRYDASYTDYGGTANVEFYETSNEQWRVVLVFMHAGTNEPDEVQQILGSFSWKNS